MNWQNVIVYVILVVCGLWIVRTLLNFFSKKSRNDSQNKCANCNCECKLKTQLKTQPKETVSCTHQKL
jgi:hypothetical protein